MKVFASRVFGAKAFASGVLHGSTTTTTSRDQLGVARIVVTIDQDQTGASRITATTTKTQLGVARVQATTARTETGISRVTVTAQHVQSGVARIGTATQFRTQLGVGNIRNTTSRDQLGVARVQRSTAWGQSGISRVQQTRDQDQFGVAHIIATIARLQTGLSRIQSTSDRPQTGLARIRQTAQQLQLGIARILQRVARSQLGVAALRVIGVQRTQLGTAKIVTHLQNVPRDRMLAAIIDAVRVAILRSFECPDPVQLDDNSYSLRAVSKTSGVTILDFTVTLLFDQLLVSIDVVDSRTGKSVFSEFESTVGFVDGSDELVIAIFEAASTRGVMDLRHEAYDWVERIGGDRPEQLRRALVDLRGWEVRNLAFGARGVVDQIEGSVTKAILYDADVRTDYWIAAAFKQVSGATATELAKILMSYKVI